MLLSDGAVAPISLSDTTVVPKQMAYYPPAGVALSAKFASYAQIYRTQLWVATLVNKVAYAAARLPLKVYRRTDTGRDDARDSPYGQLMQHPNRRMDPFFFWLWTASTFEVYGEAMWVKYRPRPSAPPGELWPLHPANVSTRRDDDGSLVYILNYGITSLPQLTFPERDIVHFRSYNPDSPIRGLSRLEPLAPTLLNEDAARRATTGFWANGARPSTYLTHPGKLSQEAQDRLRASWDTRHAGVDNFGKTAVLEEGMEPHTVSLTAEEAQYIETRRLNREEACGLFDVPPPVVHILDKATFSNITEQMRSMYRDTMAPRLGLFESVMDTQLRSEFDSDLYAEFLMEEVLRGSFEARAMAYQQADYMTVAEKRQAENLPFIEGTDKIFVNAATIPLDEAGKNTKIDQATGAAPPPPVTKIKALSPETIRTVMGRVGRLKSLTDLDPERVTAGLNGDAATVLALLADADDLPQFCDRLQAAGGTR